MLKPAFLLLLMAGFCSAAEPAPKFFAKSVDGEKFTNDSVKGKTVLVQFWQTTCTYCRGEQPVIDSLTREYADKGLVVLAVDVGEPKKRVKQYLEQSPRACKIVLMEDTNLAAMFAAKAFPLYVLIDPQGNFAGTQKGAAGEQALRRFLQKAGLDE
jgi:thiol-disulfide isomerase/thioredoxin